MSITNYVNELHGKMDTIENGGGEAKVGKQHEKGKLTARERIEKLFDQGSFVEVDAFIETRSIDFDMQKKKVLGDGVVTGYGTVNGRPVYVSSQDFTVIGGSLGEMHAKKICKVMDMAVKTGCPFVSINDSGGARIEEGIDALAGFGEIFYRNTQASGVIPQISVILGPCAGGAVYSPAITDFVFMVKKTSHMFITGPSVIKAVTGEDVTFDELGGSETHNSTSGVAQFDCENEEQCILSLKELLSYLPDNNLANCPVQESNDDINRLSKELYDIMPDTATGAYNVKDIINQIVDNGSFYETSEEFAKNIVTGFARFNGKTVGIVANQPNHKAGVLDVDSSDKGARFVRFCDSFNIPIVSFTDVPGYLPGVEQEYKGLIRHGAKLLYAFSEATVPKINVILRKAYGGAYIAMNSKHLGADLVYAWPSAEIAVMGSQGAANIIFRKEIKNSDDPIATRQEKIQEYKDRFSNPYIAAARGYVDDVIDPATSRVKIIAALGMLEGKRESRPSKKHGNIPL